MKFEDKYFQPFDFTKDQVRKNLDNAIKDLGIAKKDQILEVKFNYAYSALIKAGLALLSHFNQKTKSVPGHHIKIIGTIASVLNDESINDIGNVMRTKRNLDMYSGGIEITEKECRTYIDFVNNTIDHIKEVINY